MTLLVKEFPNNDPTAFRVRTFTALVEEAGRLFAEKQHADILFRGQNNAYVHADGQHSVRPRLYRHGNLAQTTLDRYLGHIRKANDVLLLNQQYARSRTAVEALFAHYERYETRMLDATHVLHVAASFALADTGGDRDAPAVVYALDVRGGHPRPQRGRLGKALVASTTMGAATRPMRQAAWVIWQHDAGCEVVDFGTRVLRAFLILPEDRAHFWDCNQPLDYAWLMRGDAMADVFRQP
jgi:hypothetical protein